MSTPGFAVELGKAKAVAAFLIPILGAVAVTVAVNSWPARIIATLVAVFTAIGVYVIPTSVTVTPIVDVNATGKPAG